MQEVEELERNHWQEINDFEFSRMEFLDELQAIRLKTEETKRQLEILKQTNVFNDAFR